MNGSNIAAAILAGGKNKRMGENKAFLKINGRPIIEKLISVLKPLFDEIIIVTNTPEGYAPYEKDLLIISDKIKNVGPLGGIHAALSYTSKESVFFVACDMPFLHNDIIIREISLFSRISCDALVPKTDSFLEPLHAIYRKSIVSKLGVFIKGTDNYAIRRFLETINTSYMEIPGDTVDCERIFKNINTPQDLKSIS